VKEKPFAITLDVGSSLANRTGAWRTERPQYATGCRRVARGYEEFVAKQGITFRACPGAVRLDDLVRFGWEAVSAETGEVVGGGAEILLLDTEGRIRTDYMFPGA
jgi:hypothetical protein